MESTKQRASTVQTGSTFNHYKLQAAACMLASAAVSIGLTWFAISRLF